MPNVFSDHHHWHSSTIDSIKAVVPSSVDRFHSATKLVYSYYSVFHGFSAVLSKDELEALKKLPGFVSAYKDTTVCSRNSKRSCPRARLAVYEFSFIEGSFTSDLIAAMDQAVADGVDAISICQGYGFIPLYEDAISIASFGAMMKGVLVSDSAGNRGNSVGTVVNGSP
ncbi:hypothetical protein FXO38_31851 [Capsicum annuum]|nr:hypothetical protein FXO38_31851 [Capsicum annuum]KAF3656843.1 hypothetical protein FXO37_15258 [Capsicum annuum]